MIHIVATAAALSDLQSIKTALTGDNISEFEREYEMLMEQKDKLSKALTVIQDAFEPRSHGCGGQYMWTYYFCTGGFSCCSSTHLTMHIFFLFLVILFCLFISALSDPSLSLTITSLCMIILLCLWTVMQIQRIFKWRTNAASLADTSFLLILEQLNDVIKVDKVHLSDESRFHYRDSVTILKMWTYILLIALTMISIISASLLMAVETRVELFAGDWILFTFVFYIFGASIAYFGMYFTHKYGETQQMIEMLTASSDIMKEINTGLFVHAHNIRNESVDVGNLSDTEINEIKDQTHSIIAEYYYMILSTRYGDDSKYEKETTVIASPATTVVSEKLVNIASLRDEDHAEMLALARDDSIGLIAS